MAVVVELEVHTIDVRTGLWCDVCSLPSRVEADMLIVGRQSLRVIARKTGSMCPEHEHEHEHEGLA